MKNRFYRLVKPGVFRVDDDVLSIPYGAVVVRPTYLSICAADQRYWSGRRDIEALRKKLPMALVHEAVGTVYEDPAGTFAIGTPVVMVPNFPDPNEKDTVAKENYARGSRFASSSADGFMQDYVTLPAHRLVKCNDVGPLTAVMAELVSVCIGAYDNFRVHRHVRPASTVGIWGDGTIGYLLASLIAKCEPNIELEIFGTHDDKLERFDFAHATHNVRKEFKRGLPQVDHAFECVGGTSGCTTAIEQIIDCVRPQGVISLMGVSEQPVPINTRMVLEKGLTIQGNSRSSKRDFVRAIEYLADPEFSVRVSSVVRRVIPVHNVEDMQKAFELDEANSFKTVMQWEV